VDLGKAEATTERRYREAVARATADVVRRQVDAGIDIVNDGEYGKSSWSNYVLDRLTGFELRSDRLFEAVWLGRDRTRFHEFMKVEFPRGVTGSPRARLRGTDHVSWPPEHPPQHRRRQGGL
jgi:5-methyltetrahydropteroyltriglutamate--homocysteine methyltransferase